MKLLSISIAAYNLGSMIEDNLKSLLACEKKDYLDIIVVDDGSKDNTADIVQNYANKYPGIITLVRKKNEGAGSTVNCGIKKATGKYFRMIDGDDWVNSRELDKLLQYLMEIDADVIINNYDIYNEQKCTITEKIKYELKDGIVLPFETFATKYLFPMHSVIYRTSILQSNKIRLDNGFYTDVEYLLLPVPFLNSAVYFDLDIYVYRIAREGQSVSAPSLMKNLPMHDLVLSRLIDYYENNKNVISKEKKYYISKRISNMADAQLTTLLLFDVDKTLIEKIKEFINKIKQHPDIYQYFKNGKKVKVLFYSNYFLTKLLSKKIKSKLN